MLEKEIKGDGYSEGKIPTYWEAEVRGGFVLRPLPFTSILTKVPTTSMTGTLSRDKKKEL